MIVFGVAGEDEWYLVNDTIHQLDLRKGCKPTSGRMRIGMSMSIVGSYSDSSTLASVQSALHLWMLGFSVPVAFCVMDDRSDEALAKEIYMDFVNESNGRFGGKMHLLLGPSTYWFRQTAASVADRSGTIIMLWSTPPEHNTFLQHVSSPDLDKPPSVSQHRLNSSGSGVAVPCEQQLELPLASREGPWFPGRGRRMQGNAPSDPDGLLWDQGYNYVFDIAVPPSQYTRDALFRLKQQGSTTIMCVQAPATVEEFLQSEIHDCSAPLAIAKGIGYSKPKDAAAASLVMGLSNVSRTVSFLSRANPDVLVLSMDMSSFIMCIYALKALHYAPRALVSSSAFGSKLSEHVTDFMLNYIIVPVPIVRFWYGWQGITTPLHTNLPDPLPTLPFIQILSVHAIIDHIISITTKGWQAGDHHIVAQLMREQRMSTQMGSYQFDNKGKLVDPDVVSVQYLPPVIQEFPEPMSEIMQFYRYGNSHPEIISTSDALIRKLFAKANKSVSSAIYPFPSWQDKEASVYPCEAGCVVESLARSSCSPCGRGTYRSASDVSCVRLQPSARSELYADEEGLAAPRRCETGALCNPSAPWEAPVAREGYFRIDAGASSSLPACGLKPARYRFEPCIFPANCARGNVCKNEHKGFLCSECEDGYSYHGPVLDRGSCSKCPGSDVIFATLLCLMAIYLCIVGVFVWSCDHWARKPNSLCLSVLRNILSHLHILAAIVEPFDAIDKVKSLSIFPGSIAGVVTRPFEFTRADCLWKNQVGASNEAPVHGAVMLGMAFLPFGYAVIVLGHVLCWVGGRYQIWRTMRREEPRLAHASKLALEQRTVLRTTILLQQCIVWTLIGYPICVRGCLQVTACTSEYAVQRMRMALDIECGVGFHKTLSIMATTYGLLVALGAPLLFLFLVYWYREQRSLLSVRRRLGVLITGFDPRFLPCQSFFMLRTGAIMALIGFVEPSEHDETILFILVAFLVLFEIFQPFEIDELFALRRLERTSVVCLLWTLLLGMACASDKATIILSRVRDHHEFLVKFTSAINFSWILLALLTLFRNQVAISLAVTSHGQPPFRRGGLFRIARRLLGLTPVSLTMGLESDGHSDGAIELGELSASEIGFMAVALEEIMTACIGNRNEFQTSFLMAAVAMAHERAGATRSAAHLSQVNHVARPWCCGHLRRSVSDYAARSHRNMLGQWLTVKELYNSLLQTSQHILESPLTFPWYTANEHLAQMDGARAPGDGVVQKAPSVHFGENSLDEQMHSTQQGSEREVFEDSVDRLLRLDPAGEAVRENGRLIKQRIRDARVEVDYLRHRLAACTRARSNNMRKNSDEAIEQSKHTAFQSQNHYHRGPFITADIEALDAQRVDGHAEPLSALSPRARSVVDITTSNSQATACPMSSMAPAPSDGRQPRPFSGLLTSRTDAASARVVDSSCMALAPEHIALAPKAAQEGLELHFDAPFNEIHTGVFNALLLVSLRNIGATEAEITKLRLTQHDSCLDGLRMELRGPADVMRSIRWLNLSNLNVMGYAVKLVLPLEPPQPSSRHGCGITRASASRSDTFLSSSTWIAQEHSIAASVGTAQPCAHIFDDELADAFFSGRLVDAYRKLQRLETAGADPRWTLSDADIERVRRIAVCYMDTLASFEMGSDWQVDRVEREGHKLALGLKIADGMLRTVSTCDYEGCDALHAFAALLEVDLGGNFNSDLVSACVLGRPHACDAIWRVVTHSKDTGSKEDTILQVSTVDALDEASGALWVCMYTPAEQGLLTELRGVPLPPLDPGMARLTHSVTAYRIVPLWRPHGAGAAGFRLTISAAMRPPSSVYNFMWMMPPGGGRRGLLKILCGSAQDFARRLKDYMASSSLLAERLKTSVHAVLYKRIQQRLRGGPSAAVAPTVPLSAPGTAPTRRETEECQDGAGGALLAIRASSASMLSS